MSQINTKPHMPQSDSFFAMVKNESNTNRIIMLILLSYPALLLTVRSSMGVLFGVLLIISAIQLYRMRKSLLTSHWDGYSIAFALAMASPIVAIFLSEAYHGDFKSPPYDWASRFLLAIPIFLALRQTNIRTITVLQFGMPLGALAGLIVLLVHPFAWGDRYTTSEFFNLIHFSDTALMLGFLSLFSINWERKDPALILALKLCGFIAGMYMSIQSGERGGWLAIPLLLPLWVTAHSQKKLWLKLGIAIPVIIGAVWLSYSMPGIVHDRVDLISSDLNNYTHGNKDTSLGIRLQHWQAALHLLSEHPFFGVGPNGFEKAMPELQSSGLLTPEAARMGSAEVHNEILEKCAETGLFGLFSLLSVYLVPVLIFWHTRKATESSIRIASFMGICLVLGFFLFGLTVEIFNLRMTAGFFSFTLAVLMAAATHREREEKLTMPENLNPSKILATNDHTTPPKTEMKPHKKNHIAHYALLGFAPAVAVLALTVAVIAVTSNQSSQAQLSKAAAQIENLNTSLSASQSELEKLKAAMAQEKNIQDNERKNLDDRMTIIIQNITPLQKKLKISPTLEEQLRQPSSAVTQVTNK